jgi:CDP-diacylglycerol--serine O-phosphatidyltransferase
VLIPNLVTLLALCAGLTAIRMAIEDRIDLAVYAIVAAAVLDAVDGRLARLLKGTSRFGAELDSLADFVNFGVAPAVLLYVWTLNDLDAVGWAGALAFAISAALRLARFNVALEAPGPAFTQDFFVGVPAPAGAIVVLLPIHIGHLQFISPVVSATVALVFTLAIALLMVSRVPSWSFKRSGARIARDWVAPLFVSAVLFVVLLMSYPWPVLTLGSIAYLVSLPLAWLRYRRLELLHLDAQVIPAEPAPAEPSPDRPPGAAAQADHPRLH